MGFFISLFKSSVKHLKTNTIQGELIKCSLSANDEEMISKKYELDKNGISMNFLMPEEFFYEPRKLVITEIENIKNEPEMSEFESAFLCGLIKKFKPKKILEVGIAAGGTSAIILKCLDILQIDANLISVDLNKQFYRNKEKESGFLADQVKIKGDIKHTKILGRYLPEIIETIGYGIDFFVLDTVHRLPGELLDFPVALPFLSENCIFCIHDVAYQINRPGCMSNQLLYDTIVADKLINYGSSNDKIFFPNISAAKLNSDTRKYIWNYFNAFSMPWAYMPKDAELNIYSNFFHKYYKKIAFVFDLCCEAHKKSLAKQQQYKKSMNKILFDYFICKYKHHNYILSDIAFEYDKNMNWIALNVSDDKKVHYEVYITSDYKIGIALHMGSKKYDHYYNVFLNNKLLHSLDVYKPEINCDNYTVVVFRLDIRDIDICVKILNFLIANTIDVMYDVVGINVKLNYTFNKNVVDYSIVQDSE